MKNISKITIALATVGAAAIVIYASRRIDTKRRLIRVADEGYETAHDILYPNKASRHNELRFGPVLPE